MELKIEARCPAEMFAMTQNIEEAAGSPIPVFGRVGSRRGVFILLVRDLALTTIRRSYYVDEVLPQSGGVEATVTVVTKLN